MEHIDLTWTRPDGKEAVAVTFTYATAQEASDVLERILAFLGHRLKEFS